MSIFKIFGLISRLFIKVDYAGMVNIIADEKIMPEYIQEKATVKAITNEAIEIISDRKIAVETALSRMDDHSILLVLGKGRDSYQEIGTEKQPYSDIDIIREFQYAG